MFKRSIAVLAVAWMVNMMFGRNLITGMISVMVGAYVFVSTVREIIRKEDI